MRVLPLLFATAVALVAQTPRQPPCQAEESQQFDFWLGDWEIQRWNRTGPGDDDWREGTATNLITKEYKGCVIREVFRTGGRGNGESLSVWDNRAKKWRQAWVDNNGGYLDFEGEWHEDKQAMILSLERETPRGTVIWRMVWDKISDDSIHWRYENSRDGGKTWFPTLRSIYTRKGEP